MNQNYFGLCYINVLNLIHPKSMVKKNISFNIFYYLIFFIACQDTSVDISWDACLETENLNEVQYRIILGRIFFISKLNISN